MRALGPCAIAAAIPVAACAPPAARDASTPASPAVATPANTQTSARATSTPRTIPETEAWALIRATMPAGIPVAQPTWLPPWIDRSRVALTDLRGNAQDPRYTVTYFSSTSGRVELVVGIGPIDPPDAAASGLGTRVRGVPATLTVLSSLLIAGPATQGQRRLRWVEGKSSCVSTPRPSRATTSCTSAGRSTRRGGPRRSSRTRARAPAPAPAPSPAPRQSWRRRSR